MEDRVGELKNAVEMITESREIIGRNEISLAVLNGSVCRLSSRLKRPTIYDKQVRGDCQNSRFRIKDRSTDSVARKLECN